MVKEPEKEIRFTRSRQAQVWFILACLSGISIFISIGFSIIPEPYGTNDLKNYWYLLIPLAAISIISIKIAFFCLKYAYLIFTPMGIEIFPFRKAEKNLNVIYWSEIDSLEVDKKKITLHFNKEKTAGVVISLNPIAKKHLPLLNTLITRKKEYIETQQTI